MLDIAIIIIIIVIVIIIIVLLLLFINLKILWNHSLAWRSKSQVWGMWDVEEKQC